MKTAILSLLIGFGFTLATALADTAPTEGLVNYETPHVHPIDLTPNKQLLLVVNTAGHILEVFDATGSAPVLSKRIPVGVDPVSVRARSNTEAWVVNHVSDSVSIVNLSTGAVTATVQTGNEPADVVFAGSPQRAFVSCSEVNRIDVFNPANLNAAPVQIPIAGEDPRALAVSPNGLSVYAAIFESGNATTAVSGGGSVNARNVVSRPEGPYAGVNPPPNNGTTFSPPIAAGLPTAPRSAMIVRKNTSNQWFDDNNGDWSLFVNGAMAGLTNRQAGWDLLDHDVAVINTQTLAVSYQSRLMNMVMAIDVNPVNGRISVVGTEALNEVRFEPNLNGVFLRVNSASFTVGGSSDIDDLNKHLNYNTSTTTAALRNQSIGDPRGIAWRSNGQQAFVTGMGSNNVVIINGVGNRVGRFEVGEGPTGIVLDDAAGRGYVLNKFAGTVSVIDIAAQTETAEVAFDDPTPQVIKDGRPFLYDTHLTSGLGHVSCASCHVDARNDRLSWDLGDPTGAMATVLNASNSSGNTAGTTTVHPMKGPMLTQTLQDIMGFSKLHWRGDRDDLAAFNPAFVGLMGAPAQISTADMDKFGDFLATIHLPPNPYRNIDNTRPATVTLPSGFVATTTTFNALRGSNSRSNNCMGCHMNGEQRNDASNQELSQAFIAGAWSPMYDRMGFWPSLQTGSTSGFGFFHDGADDVHGAARTDTAENQTDMLAELMTLEGPDGMLQGAERRQDAHAGVGQQVTIQGTVTSAQNARVLQLRNIANASIHAELIVRGKVNSVRRGYLLTGGSTFQADSAGEIESLADLLAFAAAGNPLTFTIVTNGMGTRLALDEDLDGTLNFDENPNLAFGGTPPTLPSRIQAEAYDTGGAGVSYFDQDNGNNGGQFRNDDVDVENSGDFDGTPSVGWAETGEWLHYSVNVVPGSYRFVVRAASPLGNPGSLRVRLDGTLLKTINVSSTGGWDAWQDFVSTPVTISGNGPGVLRFEFIGDDFNLNWVDVIDANGTFNDPPELAAIGNQNSIVNTADIVQLSASDPNGNSLSFSASGLPTGMALSGSVISGNPTVSGSFQVTVTVSDGAGGTDSETFTWTVAPGGGGGLAFGGVPPQIPARIQAENYDTGGAFISYLDNDAGNNGGAYRNDDVDLEDSQDSDATPAVGWAEGGEWLNYSIDATPGTYRFAVRAASPLSNPGQLRISLDGSLITTVNVTNTGDWYAWQNFLSPAVAIGANGGATLRFEFSGGDFNLNWVEVIPAGGSVNIPPVLAAIGNQTGTVGTADSLVLSATDANGDPLSYTATGLPTGLSLAGNTISGTPQTSGVFAVTATVSDGRGGTDVEIFNWTIAPTGGGGLAYGGLPPTLPARIQAENYDTGGSGISYFDRNATNVGGEYRQDGVDIELSQDADGTPSVGWAENGEWMNYTVELTPGSYRFVARAASELSNPGALRVSLDGTVISTIDITSTNGWYTWQNFISSPVQISGSGLATIRLQIIGDDYNLNWVDIVPSGTAGLQTLIGDWDPTADPLADADADGRPALMEHALGTADDDGVRGPGGLSIESDGGETVAGVLMLPTNISGIGYYIETSADRISWQDAGVADAVTTLPNGLLSHRYGGLESRGDSAVGIFLGYARLRVEHTDSGATAVGPTQAWYRVALKEGLSTFGISVARRPVFGGAVDSVSGDSLSFSSGDFTILFGDGEYYLEVQDGTHAGHRFEIDEASSSSAGVLSLEANGEYNTLTAVPTDLAGARILVRPHHLLADALNPRRFAGSLDAGLADQIQLYENGAFATYFMLEFGGIQQWTSVSDATLGDAGQRVLAPGQGMFVERGEGIRMMVVTGEMRDSWFARPLQAGFNLVAGGHAIQASPLMREMGIDSGGFAGTLDPSFADRFHLWGPDAGGASAGYLTHFLLDAGAGTALRYWTGVSDSSLLSVDEISLFEPGRAAFIELKGSSLPGYRYPAP